MAHFVYGNFTIRCKDMAEVPDEKDLAAFREVWDREYEGYTDCKPALEDLYACNGRVIYARADVGRHFNPSFLLEFTKANPHLQIEIIEEDYDEDYKCRYLLEGEILEKLHEIRYFEHPAKIDWPG